MYATAPLAKREGDLLAARGDVGRAAAAYERACSGYADAFEPDDPELAACRLALARALGPTPRARTLAEQALAALRRLGEGFAADRVAAEALLAELAAP